MSFNVVDPEKITNVRGNRSLRQIAAKSNGAFGAAALLGWERGIWKPKPQNIQSLLEALDCNFEDISSPFEEVQKKIKNF